MAEDVYGAEIDLTPPSRKPGIRDVARRAGVSAATASRALRLSPAVTSQTRDRVWIAANELGYSVSTTAERSSLVCVVSGSPKQWYFASAITAIEERLSAADHRLELHNLGNPASRRAFFERVLPRRQLDALLVVSSSFDDHERRALDEVGVPVAVFGGFVPGRRCVGIDEVAAARMAVQHLIGLGHREIGMIAFDPYDQVGRESTLARRQGFELALAEAGLPLVSDWVVAAEGSRMAGGVRAAERLLTRSRLPTAIFAMSDELAIGALGALRRAGLSLPGHMSLVGFDDHEMAPYVDLTTIRQPIREQGIEVARLLLDGETTSDVKTELPVRLMVRGTTGPVR